MIQARFDGVKGLISALEDFKKSISRLDIEKASEAALLPVLPVAISNLRAKTRRKTGNLEDAIEVRKMSSRMKRRYGYYAGCYLGVNYKKGPHGHLIEYGTGMRSYRRKKGGLVSTGSVAPMPFIRPAYESQREQIFKRAAEVLHERLTKKLKRALRQASKK